MKEATLGIIWNPARTAILLGEKKRGTIGVGRLSGPGGKIAYIGEPLKRCLFRETLEEFEIVLDPWSFQKAGAIDFYATGVLDFRVTIYEAFILSGVAHETPEMKPEWCPVPLSDDVLMRMYDGDRHWYPRMLNGSRFNANVYYRDRACTFDRIKFLPFVPETAA